jgi:hypothetical protein
VQLAIELALTVCCALLTEKGLEFLAEQKNCWTAVVIEIESSWGRGMKGNVATTRANRIQEPAKIKCKVKTNYVCTQQILNHRAK